MHNFHVAVVILNYNSEDDLRLCAEQVAKQTGIKLYIILVDNASRSESLAAIKIWLSDWCSNAVYGKEEEIHSWVHQYPSCARESGRVFLIENSENRGYSAGNNIGIRLADTLNADAVLIANPDMRFDNPKYLEILAMHLFANPQNLIAVSRILGLDEVDQNPLREPGFLEELLWPRWLLQRFLSQKSYVLHGLSDEATVVPKVSGCCLMLSMCFLRSSNYLDENVFLYCEEPILAAKVRAVNGNIIYVPTVSAIHAHDRCKKGNDAKRMLLFIESRKYYLKKYSGYNKLELFMLNVSYSVLKFYNLMKGWGKV